MRKDKSFLQQLLDQSDLAEENIPGKPIVELLGDCRILVENHRGIAELGTDLIEIKGGKAALRIRGEGLALKAMNRTELLITGRLFSVELE